MRNPNNETSGLPSVTRSRRQPDDADQAAAWYQIASSQLAAHLSRLAEHLQYEDQADLLPLVFSMATSTIEVGRMGVVSGWDAGPEWLGRDEGDQDGKDESAEVARGAGA